MFESIYMMNFFHPAGEVDAGCSILDTRYSMLDAGYWIRVTRHASRNDPSNFLKAANRMPADAGKIGIDIKFGDSHDPVFIDQLIFQFRIDFDAKERL
jgi:hypothetical protein